MSDFKRFNRYMVNAEPSQIGRLSPVRRKSYIKIVNRQMGPRTGIIHNFLATKR